MKLKPTVAVALLAAAAAPLAVRAQIVPKDHAEPVQVVKAKGEFAKKLAGITMPTGKGWHGTMDAEKRIQLMIPEKWKITAAPGGEAAIVATPPGHDKDARAMLLVIFQTPKNDDPLEIDEQFAESYAESQEEDPQAKRMQFKATDSALVLMRGMKFALGGWSMVNEKKEPCRQQQLLFAGDDRVVSIQFVARDKEFAQYADDVAKIFASYQNIGVRKNDN